TPNGARPVPRQPARPPPCGPSSSTTSGFWKSSRKRPNVSRRHEVKWTRPFPSRTNSCTVRLEITVASAEDQLVLFFNHVHAQVFAGFLFHLAKPDTLIEPARRDQRTHRPEDDVAVTVRPGKGDCLVEQAFPKSRSPRSRINQEPA